MRLGIVTSKVGLNDGQGRVNWEIATEALRQGNQVLMFAEEVEAGLPEPIRSVLARPPAWLPSRLLRDQLFAWRSLRQLDATANRCDVILANGFATWARSDVNAVHFVHGSWLRSAYHPWRLAKGPHALYARLYNGLNAKLERGAFGRARRVVAVSDKVHQELLELGIPAAQITTIINGVDTDEFRPGPADRGRFGLPAGPIMALFVGDLSSPRKNLETVLVALSRVQGLHLAVAGRPEGTPYPKLAASLGVADRVHFVGFVRALPDLMRAVDLFVFPSRYEGCALVLLDALASGLPVITCRSADGARLINPEVGAILEGSEDHGALAAAMRMLTEDADRRRASASRARALARRYTWQVMARRYLDILAAAREARIGPARTVP